MNDHLDNRIYCAPTKPVRIVPAVARGYWHQGRTVLRQTILEPLFEQLRHIAEDKTLPRPFRDWAWLTAFKIRPVGGASMGNTFETDVLQLIFNTTTIANIAINATASPLTAVSVGLHTSDPGEAGSETTNEIAYASYARVSTARDNSGASRWVVTTYQAKPNQNIDFPVGTAGTSPTATHFHIGTDTSTGAGKILFSGTVTPNIVCGEGIQPRLTTDSAVSLD